MARWAVRRDLVTSALDRLTDEDLHLMVQLKGHPHTVGAAAVGQIVLLERAWSTEWESLTIPRGGSEALNEQVKKA